MNTRGCLLFIVLIIFSACKKQDREQQPSSNIRSVLVYMAGDNSLAQETNDKIESLRKSYVKGMGRLLIYQDATGITPRLLEISANNVGTGVVHTLKSYPDENSANATVFKQVLSDMKTEAPANSYGLILFSHASGWLPQRTLIKPYSVAEDKQDDLELRDFAAVIPDHFFNFMIFEACFMSGIEGAYQLKDKTDYILASSAEILSPGFTPIYPQLLPFLFKPEADLKGFAQVYFDHCNTMEGDNRSATISVVKTSALPALAAWVKQNVKSTTLLNTDLKAIQHYDRYGSYSLIFDFEDYYQKISNADSHAELHRLLNEAVIYKSATPFFMPDYTGFEIKHFSGLTSYIPQENFQYLNQDYAQLEWAKAVL